MSDKNLFVYDGECPFCNMFAQLVELKSHIPCLSIKNGRTDIGQLTLLYNKGYDLDKGAILLKDDEIFHGANAINTICKEIKNPSSNILKILSSVFNSKKRTKFFF